MKKLIYYKSKSLKNLSSSFYFRNKKVYYELCERVHIGYMEFRIKKEDMKSS